MEISFTRSIRYRVTVHEFSDSVLCHGLDTDVYGELWNRERLPLSVEALSQLSELLIDEEMAEFLEPIQDSGATGIEVSGDFPEDQ